MNVFLSPRWLLTTTALLAACGGGSNESTDGAVADSPTGIERDEEVMATAYNSSATDRRASR